MSLLWHRLVDASIYIRLDHDTNVITDRSTTSMHRIPLTMLWYRIIRPNSHNLSTPRQGSILNTVKSKKTNVRTR